MCVFFFIQSKFHKNDIEKLLLSAEPNHCDRNQIRNQNDAMN